MKLLDMAKSFLIGRVPEDGVAVDFTMGNGHDTLFLSNLVGEGKVYAFDIQKEAFENTEKLLKDNNVSNATLILDSHSNFRKYVNEEINAGMFNLGYRPGGDKSVHTMCDTTLIAVRDAMESLAKNGILVISVYPGHSEGRHEGEEIEKMLSRYDRCIYSIMSCKMVNSHDSPYIVSIERTK